MATIVKYVCCALLGLLVIAPHPITSAESSELEGKVARTDVIDKTVLALKSVFSRTLENCDASCRSDRNAKLADVEIDDAMSPEAIDLVQKLKSGEDIDLTAVNSWIDRAGDIQRNYFNSVFRYHKKGDVKDALFFLDIGQPHDAAKELLSNQRILTQIAADCSALLSVAQGDRSGISLKLVNHLTDLTPYHDTFGCIHSTSNSGEDLDCAAVMKTAFEASFIELQDTLKKFVTTEMSEDELLNSE